MDIQTLFREKLSKIIFLEIKKEIVLESFGIELKEEIYFPIRSSSLTNKAIKGEELNNLPISIFVEGMFYVLGCDDKFRFSKVYLEILKNKDMFINSIKGIIFSEIKKEDYDEAYILLKGLLRVEKSVDNFEKYFLLAHEIRLKNDSYTSDILKEVENAKYLDDYSKVYLHEAMLTKDDKDYSIALASLNNYIEKGGDVTEEVQNLKETLFNLNSYDKGKELVFDNPEGALEYLLPLIEKYDDDAYLLYNIAVAYRNLRKNKIAIEYLEVALAIDDALVQVVNELGINYASIGEYTKAIECLRKAFEATKSIEICTNLVLCYHNIGDNRQARLHLDIAEKIKPNDEVVNQLKEIIK